MEVSYRRELDHNYLVLEEKEYEENYQVQMLLKNRIPGFLECRMTRVDRDASFYYEITSRQNLRLVLERKRISLTELVKLLAGYPDAAITYAGGVGTLSDLELLRKWGQGRIDVTVGSALDLFGGTIPYDTLRKLR